MEWLAFAIFLSLLLLLLYEQVKPVDKKWSTFTRVARLPPGPKGVPLFGNLLQFWNARENGRLTPYVSRRHSHSQSNSYPERILRVIADRITAAVTTDIRRNDYFTYGIAIVGAHQ